MLGGPQRYPIPARLNLVLALAVTISLLAILWVAGRLMNAWAITLLAFSLPWENAGIYSHYFQVQAR